MTSTFQRTISRNVDEYLACAAEVEDYVTQSRLSPGLVFKIRLVLEELGLNLIEHGTGSLTGRIDLQRPCGSPNRRRRLQRAAAAAGVPSAFLLAPMAQGHSYAPMSITSPT
jgi:hypothetical protein